MNGEKANVLLVAEDPADLAALEATLTGLGHVVKGHSGNEALRLLDDRDFAVALLDVQMSGLDGFETARQLRERPRLRQLPIIFLSAHDDRPALERAYALGAADYLVKPLLPAVLRAKVAVFVELFQKAALVERKMDEENARYRALTEHSSDAVTLLGPDGTVVSSNPSSRRLLGYEPGELLGRSGLEIVHPDDQGRGARLLAELVREPGRPVTVELRVRHKTGPWLWMECVGTNLLAEPTVRAIVVNYHDISERHRATGALRQSEERFRQLAENIREVFWMSDPPKTEVLYISPTYEEVWGRSCQSLYEQPRSFLDAIHPDDRERVLTASLERQGQGQPADVQYRIVRPDGSQRWIRDRSFPVQDDSGRVYRMAGIAEDVTALKAAEDALRESEGRFRQVVECIPQLVWVNLADGTVEYLNRRCLDYVGVSQEAMFGWDWKPVVHPDDLPKTLQAVEHTMRTAEPLRVEYRLRRSDGEYRWHIGWASPLKDNQGRIVKWFGTATDIHDLKQAEEALRHAQKMEAIGRLAAGIAHDFNNWLAVISGCGEILLNSMRPGDPARELVCDIKDAGDRAASLTLQLLAFSRKTVLEPRVLDLNDQVRQVEPLLRRLVGKGVELTTDLGPGSGRVWADPGQFQQAVINLAANARDATPQGGRLTIRTRKVSEATHAEARPGPHVLLEVSDSGCGMTEEVKARIFEPFFTTKEYGKGTGLGLALVYGFVKQSQGYVAVESEPGKGTTFRIYLPCVEEGTSQVPVRG